ncbi:IniB N-terminal domain-containing protein [Actinomycetospora endophytica]|uniref:IniB N-terminal domain-containing protein n=1 Tax=Actinomycetospora endophytica TaxID=2291215 RepID=A0ABS8PDK9_9PSEU|nr:IniB N-terminal domain-containing protein [Actinomycetospora endophytica]MCD2196365.1 IniB N-terminal domain-containing protein [Actinomycetospora endophytica]
MPVTEAKTILQFLLDLLRDPNAQAAFAADPHGTLASAGLDNLCFADVRDALPLVMDHAPAAVAARYDDDVRAGTASTAAVVSDPGHHWNHGGHHEPAHHWSPAPVPAHHGPEVDKVISHLNWTTNNYSFDSHDTTFTTALDQHIIANGDVTTTVDTHPQVASGDGAVAVGGNLAAPVATGTGSVAGDANQVNHDGTASFGAGDATSVGGSVGASHGGAVSLTDPATGTEQDSAATSFGSGDSASGSGTAAVTPTHDQSDNSTHTATATDTSHSGNTDNSTHDATSTGASDADAGSNDAGPLFAHDAAPETHVDDALAAHEAQPTHEVAVH